MADTQRSIVDLEETVPYSPGRASTGILVSACYSGMAQAFRGRGHSERNNVDGSAADAVGACLEQSSRPRTWVTMTLRQRRFAA